MRKLALQTISAVLFLFSPLLATTIRVPQDQPTIQAGINAAANGDTVLVSPGTYTEIINFSGKNILVQSVAGAEATVLIPPTSGQTLVTFSSGAPQAAILGGFKIKGASSPNGAVLISTSSSAILRNNIFEDDTVTVNNDGSAAGVSCINCTALIESNRFQRMVHNGGGYGTAVHIQNGSATVRRNVFTNTVRGIGTARFVNGSSGDFINNTFDSNKTYTALLVQNAPSVRVRNNIVTNTESYYGIYVEGGNSDYNDAYGNALNFYPSQSSHDISSPPLFVGGSPFSYHLQTGSPCIDAGDPATPVPPSGGARVDMGAFEFAGIGLIFPPDEDRVALRRPQFIWTRIPDTAVSATYRVVLDTASNFASADSSPPLADTTYRFPYQLELNQSYFWKVFAVPDSGDTVFTGGSRFSVSPSVVLNLPQDSSRVFVKQPIFVWEAVRDTSIPDLFTYQVLYSKNSNFTDASSSPILSDTSWQVPLPLDIGTTYFWRVLGFYSSTSDTLQPERDFRFLLAPTKIEVPLDRPTIQQAIDISLNGDTVLVSPGTYVQNILFRGKKIKLLSESGPENTTITKLVDGAALVIFSGSEDSNSVLSGFTLRGGHLATSGAAISIVNASPIIENNYLIDNDGDTSVIYVRNGSPKIRRNLIANNNTSISVIGFFGGPGGHLINNTITGNAGDGVRIIPGMGMQIINNIIAFNSGYGIRSVGGVNSSSTISYNDIFADSQGTYFAAIPTFGDIYEDPQFIGGEVFDYHLSDSSPCIDAGDPSFPPPPGGGAIIDMGAFEFTGHRGDLNRDGVFSAADIVLLVNCVFLQTGECFFSLTDLNCDGQLTGADIVLELGWIFQQIPPPC
ncbi:MAG: right-handed parallel beta-helix repeat-containing protein [candidate division Zixibacteria bacterium]|nr:right-handed parallel beta-helix repeat-containing protein [candidate division Zixibacteria bacterium]